jgi:hypothetical protein
MLPETRYLLEKQFRRSDENKQQVSNTTNDHSRNKQFIKKRKKSNDKNVEQDIEKQKRFAQLTQKTSKLNKWMIENNLKSLKLTLFDFLLSSSSPSSSSYYTEADLSSIEKNDSTWIEVCYLV